MKKKSNKKTEGFVVIYHKSPDESIKMTKTSSYEASRRSVWKFGLIGIKPCEIVKVQKNKN